MSTAVIITGAEGDQVHRAQSQRGHGMRPLWERELYVAYGYYILHVFE